MSGDGGESKSTSLQNVNQNLLRRLKSKNRAGFHNGRVYREKVRAKKNEIKPPIKVTILIIRSISGTG
jgi:hypothetical protein